MIYVLMAGLAVWMFGCAYAGYHKRLGLFAAILVLGMGANTLWMMIGLNGRPLSTNALVAHAGILLYAISAVVLGFFIGRVRRAFHASRVETDD